MTFAFHIIMGQFSSVQLLSHVCLFATPCTEVYQASLSITNSGSLLKPVHQVSDAIQPSVILFSSCLQSFPASGSILISQFFASGAQSSRNGHRQKSCFLILSIDRVDWHCISITHPPPCLWTAPLPTPFTSTTALYLSIWMISH